MGTKYNQLALGCQQRYDLHRKRWCNLRLRWKCRIANSTKQNWVPVRWVASCQSCTNTICRYRNCIYCCSIIVGYVVEKQKTPVRRCFFTPFVTCGDTSPLGQNLYSTTIANSPPGAGGTAEAVGRVAFQSVRILATPFVTCGDTSPRGQNLYSTTRANSPPGAGGTAEAVGRVAFQSVRIFKPPSSPAVTLPHGGRIFALVTVLNSPPRWGRIYIISGRRQSIQLYCGLRY